MIGIGSQSPCDYFPNICRILLLAGRGRGLQGWSGTSPEGKWELLILRPWSRSLSQTPTLRVRPWAKSAMVGVGVGFCQAFLTKQAIKDSRLSVLRTLSALLWVSLSPGAGRTRTTCLPLRLVHGPEGLMTRAQDGLVGGFPLLLHEAWLHRPHSDQNPALMPCSSSLEMLHTPLSPSSLSWRGK